MKGTITGQTCEGPIEGYPRNTALFFRTGDFTGEATADVTFHVEERQMLESFSGEHAGIITDAGQRLALFDSSIWTTSAHFETSFQRYGNWNSDEGSFRDQVCSRFSQGTAIDALVSKGSITVNDANLVGTAGIAFAG